MEDKIILNPEVLPEKLVEEIEKEEFHHVNNPAAGIKPIVKNTLEYLLVRNKKGINSFLLMVMPG